MTMLWWQNGRDIDWFSTNLEKWIKPGVVSTQPNPTQNHGGRYSKLKSCRLSKTCQTMMYIPQEQTPSNLSNEEPLSRFQDNRTYKYSQRQQHYNAHYNYIRTSARRAYYKPETNEIVLADEYDKYKTIQRQNKAKNLDYLLSLQEFLSQQQIKTRTKATNEDFEKMTTYLNNNIQQYEQTDQSITLKQFLQEGIEKHQNDNLMTLKEFLQGTTSNVVKQNGIKKEDNTKSSHEEKHSIENKDFLSYSHAKEITLKEFLDENNEISQSGELFHSTNPFASEMATNQRKRNDMLICHGKNEDVDKTNDESFEEFLKERQATGDRANCLSYVHNIHHHSPRPEHKVTFDIEQSSNNNDKNYNKSSDSEKLSFDEFLKERCHNLGQNKFVSEETKEMTLEEFLHSEDLSKTMVVKSNEHKSQGEKINNINLKLSKSFNDKTNLIRENLFKKIKRNDFLNENNKRMDQPEGTDDDSKITLYEFLKEEDQKQNSDMENGLKNLKLRTNIDKREDFYEINNNAPDIKLNDNFIQVETQPGIKYSQYEHNRQVCACDKQYTRPYNQFLTSVPIDDKIEFIDRSYDYHRKVHQNEMHIKSPSRDRACSKMFTSVSPGRRCKSKHRTHSPPVVGIIHDGMYGPMWPSVLLTYDKVVSPKRSMYDMNESYA